MPNHNTMVCVMCVITKYSEDTQFNFQQSYSGLCPSQPVAGWFGRRSLVCLRDCYMVVCEGCACVTCSDDRYSFCYSDKVVDVD